MKSCFDRIVHIAVTLSMVIVRIPLNLEICILQTLQDCQQSIMTAFDDSKETHWDKTTLFIHPPQEIGQGNKTRP